MNLSKRMTRVETDIKYILESIAIQPEDEKKAESKCEICKTIEPGQLGNKFCWNCGRNLLKL